ncbi:MAG: hypothetical protein GW942_01355 [Candidatus Pacebacteria bacterium]|nr:hypothetical protein [Candidatus Paceibacterota bacterium]
MNSNLTEQQRLNKLIIDTPTLLERRKENINKDCSVPFIDLLSQTLHSNSERFGKPRVIIDTFHEGATVRSDCNGQTVDGKRCGVRATTQAIKEGSDWVLEDRGINFDRCDNNPCIDCQNQCCSSHPTRTNQ